MTLCFSDAKFEDRYVTLPDIELHYIDHGGHGSPIVALHGFVQNARAFDGIAPILRSDQRLLALDLRGRGGSGWAAPDRYRWGYYLRDLHGFLAALGLGRVTIIGTSLGGTIALLYAMAHPGDVSGLVLNDISLGASPAGVRHAACRVGRTPATFRDIGHAMGWFLEQRDGLERLDAEERLAWVSHFLTPAESGGLRLNCDPALIRQARHLALAIGPQVLWSDREPVWRYVRRLAMPVLLLRGQRSDVVSRPNANRMVNSLPQGRWKEIPGVGHAPTLYEPEARAAIGAFCATLPRGRTVNS